jgi:hypothetical protein
MFVPVNVLVGRYGGGEGMELARTILVKPLGHKPHIDPLLVLTAIHEARSAPFSLPIDAWEKKMERLDRFRTDSSLVVSSIVYGSDPKDYCNLMLHGWLFQEFLTKTESEGAISFPLVGLFSSFGLSFPEKCELDCADLEESRLKWTEQHVHLIPGFDQVHFGPDMGRIRLNQEAGITWTRVIAVDVEREAINSTILMIVQPEIEEALDKMLRDLADEIELPVLFKELEMMVPSLKKRSFLSQFAEELS